MTEIVLETGDTRRYRLELGVLDGRALVVFSQGHCHSFALAAHQRTGGDLAALIDPAGTYTHVLTATDDGAWLDIGGKRSPEELAEGGGRLEPITVKQVGELPARFGWARPRPEIAAEWVSGVLARVNDGEPWVPQPVLARSVELGSDVLVQFQWDGDTHVIAYARWLTDGAPLVRCGSMRVGRGGPDDPIEIDFRDEVFVHLVERFKTALSPDVVFAKLNEAGAPPI